MKSAAEQEELGTEFFEDINMKVRIPRRSRMKDQVRSPDHPTAPCSASVRSDSLFIFLIVTISPVFSLETSRRKTFRRGQRSTS